MKRKRRGKSVQDLLAIRTFTKHGLKVGKEELLFFNVQPTNISVLSHTNIEIKIRHLLMVLSAVPDIEISCTDSSECFDNNKSYLKNRIEDEKNNKVRNILANTKMIVPIAVTLCFGFLTIRLEDTTVMDFIKYAVKYFISTQQEFYWQRDAAPNSHTKNLFDRLCVCE